MNTGFMHRRDAETQRKKRISIFPASAPLRLCGEKTAGIWLPDMDLNHDKQIQSLLCYRYTIGQAGASGKLKGFTPQSSQQTAIAARGRRHLGVQQGRKTIALGFNRGANGRRIEPRRGGRNGMLFFRPSGTRIVSNLFPRLKSWAIFGRPSGATN